MITAGELHSRMVRAGRIHGPRILAEAWFEAEIDTEALTALVSAAWSMTEYPERDLDRDEWLDLFGSAGYTEDGVAETPPSSVRLYRGCHPDAKAGMSWSSDIEVAKKFATGGLRGRKPGRLYTALVPGRRLLSYDNDRQEHEYVVATEGLVIVEVSK